MRYFILPVCFFSIVLFLPFMGAYSQVLEAPLAVTAQPFAIPTKNGSVWGLVDKNGALILKPQYAEIREYTGAENAENTSAVAVVQGSDGKFGYINTSGKLLHPVSLDNARAFSAMGVARFEKNELWGFIDLQGKIVIKPQFNSATPMQNGFAVVGNGKKVWFIDESGKQAIKAKFAKALNFNSGGLAAVQPKKNGKWGVIDRQGEWVIDAQFAELKTFNENGFAPAAQRGMTWGVIDTAGKWVVKPKYKRLSAFNDKNLAIHKDASYYSTAINVQGEDVYAARQNTLHISGQCDAMHNGHGSLSFVDLRGKKLKSLNEPRYDWFSGFNSDCFGLAVNNQQWGRLKRDGTFTEFSAQVVEPYTHQKYAAEFIALRGAFLPAITSNRDLVYLDLNGQVALTTKVENNKKGDELIVSDAKGQELWRASYAPNTLLSKHTFFFKPSSEEFGFDETWLNDVSPVTDVVLASPSKYYLSYYDEGEEASSEDIGSAIFGSLNVLAKHYVSEYDWGRYYFMESAADFTSQFKAIEQQLIKKYGSGFSSDDAQWQTLEGLNYFSGDYAQERAWKIDDAYLVLDYSTSYGDGDISKALKLARVQIEQSSAASLAWDDSIETLNTSEFSDVDVSMAVKELINMFGSASAVQLQANKIFDLVKAGNDISQYDYLWTLYSIIRETGPELENGLSLSDYLKAADTAIYYLDDNGVGEWVFTEQGQFKMEVYRNATNGAAWSLRESQPEKALAYIEAGMDYARAEDLYMSDTHVRILLNLELKDKAFAIVKTVLDDTPDFVDFDDFHSNKEYKNWLATQ